MRVATIFFLVLLVALPAAAQEMVAWERFFPGEVGDFWRFRTENTICSGYDPPDCQTATGFRTYEVVERVQTDASISLVFESEESRCRVSIEEGDGWFTVEQLEGQHCLPLDVPPMNLNFPQDEPLAPAIVAVGDYSYTVDALKQIGECPFGCHRFAADLGVYEYGSSFSYGGQSFRDRYTLVRARVAGAEYGISVSVEPEAAAQASALELHPNPFHDRLTVRLAAAGPQRAAVEVFDLLGKRVIAREMLAEEATLDLAALGAGLYVVRVTTRDGQTVTRRVTKLQ